MIPKHLLIALDELGTKEIPGEADCPKISEYLKTVGMPGDDEIPWCAAFVNWVLRQAGKFGTGRALAKSYVTYGAQCQPMPGAIIVMNRGADLKYGHVAIMIQDNGNTVYAVGGNQNNMVSIAEVDKSKIIAYRKVL